ncbi:MAG: hypothetical protein ACRECN_00405 [Methylocella sp.]
MQATVTYSLTEQNQRAQMTATGGPVTREQIRTVEVPPEDIKFFRVNSEGELALDLSNTRAVWDAELSAHLDSNLHPGDLTPDCDILALIRAAFAESVSQARAKARAKKEADLAAAAENEAALVIVCAAAEAFLADPAARCQDSGWALLPIPGTDKAVQCGSCDFPRKKELIAEIERRNKADKAAAEADKAAREAAKMAYIAEWIGAHGTPAQQTQQTEGLLCRKTALTIIADASFSAMGAPAKFILRKACDDVNCPCGDWEANCLPEAVYANWTEIRAALSGEFSVKFYEYRECLKDKECIWDAGTAGPLMYLAELAIACGPFQFKRMVRLCR